MIDNIIKHTNKIWWKKDMDTNPLEVFNNSEIEGYLCMKSPLSSFKGNISNISGYPEHVEEFIGNYTLDDLQLLLKENNYVGFILYRCDLNTTNRRVILRGKNNNIEVIYANSYEKLTYKLSKISKKSSYGQ